MYRPKPLSTVLFVLSAVCSACSGGGGERDVIKKYFDASRLRDNTTASNISAVSFNPRTDGIVRSFDVVAVGEEQRRPLRVKELSNAHKEAKAAEEVFTKSRQDYSNVNYAEINRVLKAEREKTALKGKDAAVQAEWTKWRQETTQHARRVADARAALAAEFGIADLSVLNPAAPVDVTQHDGELVWKDMTIDAKVQTPDGQNADRQMVVTIKRAILKKPDGSDITGRWIITEIK